MKEFTVLDLLNLELKAHNELHLKCIAGRKGLVRRITDPEINRPGLTLSGFYEEFAFHRIQLFGKGESSYLRKLEKEQNMPTVEKLFSYHVSCCIFSNGHTPGKRFLEIAESSGCAVLQTDLSSAELAMRLMRALSNVFAPHKIIHGVLVEVFGIGILITGNSGVGKSETALELIERGHRLIADDSVELRSVSGNILMGSAKDQRLGHHMEIRGLGIINVSYLFGVGSIRDQKQVQMIVDLEEWDQEKVYDRLGSGENTREILGIKVPLVQVPVKAGRNIPIIIETAAMNERLKKLGYFAAREFDQNVLTWLESKNARNLYFNNKDIF